MLSSLFYLLFAIFGLGLLIFLHELGHYWMALRVGMRVEVFSIGFGQPIYSWVRNGVKWQIGWIPFGGFVKIAGTDTDSEEDLFTVKDGFFGKSPWDRIKVAFAGPVANLIVAFLFFALVFFLGGREKPFSESTNVIGWVDPHSELYKLGVRPGDEIASYDNDSFESSKDHIFAPMTASDKIEVKGYKINAASNEKTPFSYEVATYPHPSSLDKAIKTAGILASGSYLVYDKLPGGHENPIQAGSPMLGSGIEYGDRIVWADGVTIYSRQELEHVLNDKHALLTVLRGQKTLIRRVPRVEISEFRLDHAQKEELIDWQYEANLNGQKIQNLLTIPYNLTNEGVVEGRLRLIDEENEEIAFPAKTLAEVEEPLEAGDKIIAIDGQPVSKSYQILGALQSHKVFIIVQKQSAAEPLKSYKQADAQFYASVDLKALEKLGSSIGTASPLLSVGALHLLLPVEPKTFLQLAITPEKEAELIEKTQERKNEIQDIEDPEERHTAIRLFDAQEKQLLIGLPLQDRLVIYNPTPVEQFSNIMGEMWRTIKALFTGNLSPKFMSGPVGILQVVQENSKTSLKEAFMWLGFISLNLGVLNLLPIPVLDGGTILLSLVEIVTRKRIPPKVLEKIITPFAILLLCFFIYVTFNDIHKVFGSWFKW